MKPPGGSGWMRGHGEGGKELGMYLGFDILGHLKNS